MVVGMRHKSNSIGIKWYLFTLIGCGLLFVTAMMGIRLKMTELGYEFEEAKSLERSLKEEQVRLQAEISRKLSQSEFKKEWRSQGFGEPEPKQVIIIP